MYFGLFYIYVSTHTYMYDFIRLRLKKSSRNMFYRVFSDLRTDSRLLFYSLVVSFIGCSICFIMFMPCNIFFPIIIMFVYQFTMLYRVFIACANVPQNRYHRRKQFKCLCPLVQ